MKLFVNLAEVRVGDVGVDLSGGDVGVAEKGLDGAEIGAVHEEVGGERVAESVGGNVFGDAGGASVFFYDALNRARGETAIVAGSVDGLEMMRVVEEEGGQGIGASGEIFADAVGGGLRDKNRAVFLTLAADNKFATVEIDRIAVETDEFGDAEAARKEELDDGAVAQTGLSGSVDAVEHFFNFVVMEKSDLFFNGTREFDETRVEGFDASASEIFKEAAESDKMISLGDGLEVFSAYVVFVTVEAEAVFTEKLDINIGRLNIVLSEEVGADFVKMIEIEAIVFDGPF